MQPVVDNMAASARRAAAASAAATANGSGGKNAQLASMLRDCASYVERNEFHPVLYQALGALHAYAGEHASSSSSPASPVTTPAAATAVDPGPLPGPPTEGNRSRSTSREPQLPDPSAFKDVPDLFDANVSADFEKNRTAGTAAPAAAAHSGRKDKEEQEKSVLHGITKGFKKFGFAGHSATPAEKSATSTKNAERAKADIDFEKTERERDEVKRRQQAQGAGLGGESDWSEEPFAMGDAPRATPVATATPAAAAAATSTSAAAQQSKPQTTSTQVQNPNAPRTTSKPSFQRPINPNSNLIANGWIEQQRRSKMRVVWKDILASLVEGRKLGEETTLWIQRQVTNSQGKAELEALHQIPMKWLEDVTYLDFYGDHRFSLKIFNVADEFQFRCTDEESAQNWVVTLRSARQASLEKGRSAASGGPTANDMGLNNLDDWDTAHSSGSADWTGVTQNRSRDDSTGAQAEQAPKQRLTIKELRAIAHGAGINTRGMERSDLEKIAAKYAPGSSGSTTAQQSNQQQSDDQAAHAAKAERMREEANAAARAAEQQRQQEAAAAAAAEQKRQQEELLRRRQQEMAEKQAAEHRRRQAEEEKRQQEELLRRQQEMAEKQASEHRRRQAEEEQKRQQAEQQRRREAEEQRQRMAEQQAAEHRRRQAEEEQRKQAAAAAAAAEQRRKAEEEQRKRMAEQQAAEQRRQAEEEQRKRQWQQQQQWQAQQQQWQQQAQQQQQRQRQQANQQQGFYGQQQQPKSQQQQHFFAGAPPPPPPPPPRQQQQQPQSQNSRNGGAGPAGSPIAAKYAKAMGEKSEQAEQAAITNLKRNILINWALMPPMLQMLRPIDQLVSTIHTAFPPAFGVPSHAYFTKWKPISASELSAGTAMRNTPNEEKLKKAVRKIRFFLHPDKLPRDLNSEQEFMCKMLWDVTSDAWEEFCTKNEELDWIRGP